MKKMYRLPDRTTTSSATKYVDAWRALAAPVERALGGRCLGFDPAFSFLVDGKSVELSLNIVQKLATRLEELELELSAAQYASMGEDL